MSSKIVTCALVVKTITAEKPTTIVTAASVSSSTRVDTNASVSMCSRSSQVLQLENPKKGKVENLCFVQEVQMI